MPTLTKVRFLLLFSRSISSLLRFRIQRQLRFDSSKCQCDRRPTHSRFIRSVNSFLQSETDEQFRRYRQRVRKKLVSPPLLETTFSSLSKNSSPGHYESEERSDQRLASTHDRSETSALRQSSRSTTLFSQRIERNIFSIRLDESSRSNERIN